MPHRHFSKHRLSQALLIACGMTAAVMAADASVTPASAQKAQFERTKPHANVGTIGDQPQVPSGLTTSGTQGTAPQCCDTMVVDGIRDFRRKPAGGVKRRSVRIRPNRR